MQVTLPVDAKILELSVDLINVLFGQTECFSVDEGFDHPKLINNERFA